MSSRVEYVNVSGLRLDGRRPREPRRLTCRLGVGRHGRKSIDERLFRLRGACALLGELPSHVEAAIKLKIYFPAP